GTQIQDRHALAAQRRALEEWRHPTARPVANAVYWQTTRIGQYNIRGQVLVLAPQSVRDPRADRWSARDDQPRVHHPERLLVIAMVGKHRPNNRDLVGMPRDVRQGLGELDATFAVLLEFARAAHQLAG